MKKILALVAFSLLVCKTSFAAGQAGGAMTAPPTAPIAQAPVTTTEDWKGNEVAPPFTLGAMTGLGVIDSYGGFTLLATASTTVVQHGFIPDLNDNVAFEVEMGPVFTSSHAALWYSVHLRWNFEMNKQWTFYALGGLGGNDTPDSLGGHFEIWPRLGAGAIWKIDPSVGIRFEVSHEFMGIGVSVPL